MARRLGAASQLGEWLDPLADKLLTVPVWLALASIGFAPAWLVFLAVARNVAVLGAWALLARGFVSVAPSKTGQIMVAFEGVALSVLVFHGPWNGTHWPSVGTALGVVSLALSGASLVIYAAHHPLLAISRPATAGSP